MLKLNKLYDMVRSRGITDDIVYDAIGAVFVVLFPIVLWFLTCLIYGSKF